jgi:hypothetical protein
MASSGNWIVIDTIAPSIDIPGIDAGSYEIEVVSYDVYGNTSDPANVSPSLGPGYQTGSSTVEKVENFTAQIIGLDQLGLSWSQPQDSSLASSGQIEIRYLLRSSLESVLATGLDEWSQGTEIAITAISSGSITISIPPKPPFDESGFYIMAKFKSNSGSYSSSFSVITITSSPVVGYSPYIVEAELEAPPFSGQKVNFTYKTIAAGTGLVLEGGGLFDSIGYGGDLDSYELIDTYESPIDDYTSDIDTLGAFDSIALLDGLTSSAFDAIESIDSISGTTPIGEYYFEATPFDLGKIIEVTVGGYISFNRLLTSSTIDVRVDLLDAWNDFDGAQGSSGVNAIIEYSTSSDGILFSDWAPVLRPITGIQELATGRYFKFRIYATITDTSATLLITKASVWVKLNDCLDSGFQSSSTPIVFNAKFYQSPVMTISGFNTIPSNYYQITNLTALGATVTWYDANDNVVTKDYGWTAQGYGSR